ncbi:MAG: hypothetical protein NTU83_08380, partial [Candidatus Hydrogenedentes bacterium]|nr:hypothetical protein [Candidatus Hydrogenedentota bacterium]
VKLVANRRIFSLGFVMMGFPTETEAELQATIDVACQSKLHAALFFAVTPFPTTRLYDEVAQTQPAKLRCLEYEGTDYVNNMAINLSCVSDQMLVDYIRKAYRKFYGDPVRVARIRRDFPLPFQLPIMLRSVLRLGQKSAMHEPDTILNR